MPPVPLIDAGLSAATAIPEIIKLVTAAKQQQLADKYGQTPRPTYTVPGSQTEAVTNARNQAYSTTLPGQQTMEDQLGANTAAATQNASNKGNPADILATISSLNNNQNNAQNNINTSAAQYKNQSMGELNTQLGQNAAYQDKAFQVNQMEPYNNAMKAASALKNASLLNGMQGATGLASDAAMTLNSAIPTAGGTTGTDAATAAKYGMSVQTLQLLKASGINIPG